MPVRLEDYRGQFGVSKVEQELARALRAEPEVERFRIIQQLMWDPQLVHWRVAFDLVRKCLTKRESFERILEQGLDHADASSIHLWLDAVVEGLGFRRMVEFLTSKLMTHPKGVIFARYFLRLPEQGKARAAETLQRLDEAIAEEVRGNSDYPRLFGESYMEVLREQCLPKIAVTP